MLLVLAEKPSARRNFAKALGGDRGSFDGTEYETFALRGHLMGLKAPEEQVEPWLRERYQSWSAALLPWDPSDLSWEREFRSANAERVARDLKAALWRCDEVAIATDDDPTGEGELLAWEALLWCGWSGRTSRMHFVDESAPSVQAAFRERVPIASADSDGDYLKALARDRWDLLSMQLTRAATDIARSRGSRATLRQGRLKSVMVRLVGDQQRAWEGYVKKPFFEPRFRDANGNVLSAPEEGGLRCDKAEDVVLDAFEASDVVIDSTERKRTAPPRLPDLAALSGSLASKGHKASDVLECYQRMYEDQIVSYPRTEDKTITPEQFGELVGYADMIAEVVGVDPKLLTHREPRATHVKATGTHGANRPGTNVPSTMAELDRYGKCARDIYEAVALGFLAMLAEDFVYDLSKAHLERYPQFTGETRVAVSDGWHAVTRPEATERANERPWASPAEPFLYEGANKRPQEPTQRWLMKALERYEVGTGASRTSTFADCASGRWPLIDECKGKLRLTEAGEQGWTLTRGCDIADPRATEALLRLMGDVGAGKATVDDVTATMAPLVEHDVERMRANADDLSRVLGAQASLKCPRCGERLAHGRKGRSFWYCTSRKGHRDGEEWVLDDPGCGYSLSAFGHEFNDKEMERLCAGKVVRISVKTKRGTGKADVRLDPKADFGCACEFVREGGGSRGGRRGAGRGRR